MVQRVPSLMGGAMGSSTRSYACILFAIVFTIILLGCGTGKFGSKFSNDNYMIYGLDLSLDMLLVAKARAFKNFRLICSDMRNFTLAKPVDFILILLYLAKIP